MSLDIICTGSFKKTEDFLKFLDSDKAYSDFEAYGRKGTDALSAATPRDTGLASQSWGAQVSHTKASHSISWFNTDREGGAYGVNVALILQYGHGTGTGGYVEGRDYINPAMRPIFDKMVEDVWRQVRNA